MKKFIKTLLVMVMMVGYHQMIMPAMAETEESGNTLPTVKVAVFFTKNAADVYDNATLSMYEYLELRENDIRQILQSAGPSGTNADGFDVEFTAKAFLDDYQEPRHRGLPDPYTTFLHEGMDQVFDEMVNHQAILEFLDNPANDADGNGIWDNAPGSGSAAYLSDKSHLDLKFIDFLKQSKPDVVIIIADQPGEPLIVDEAMWDVASGQRYDKPLFAVVNAEYFASSPQAITLAFFSLFCRADYSDSDQNTDDDPGVRRSLMSYEWTGEEGENRLTDLNKQTLRNNLGKLKLTSGSDVLTLSGETLEYDYVQNQIDNNSDIILTPSASGEAMVISSPAAAPAFGDDRGDDVPLSQSYMAFATGNYTENAPVANAPMLPIHAVIPEDETFSVALPIDFESTITSSSYTDYVEDDYGAQSSFESTRGNNSSKGVRVIKRRGERNKWAITRFSHVSNVRFTASGNKKLKMDVKAPDTSTDVMMVLEDEQGNRVTKEYVTNDLVANGWKELEFDFGAATNRTGSIVANTNYRSISIQFNSCTTESADRTYYVDNIRRGDVPDVRFHTASVDDSTPDLGNSTELLTFTIKVKSFNSSATNVKVNAPLPNGYVTVPRFGFPRFNTTVGSYDQNTGIWTIGDLSADLEAYQLPTLTVKAYVKSNGTNLRYDYPISITADEDSNLNNNSEVIKVNPLGSRDLGVQLQVNNPSPAIGEIVSFSITAHNYRGGRASNLTVDLDMGSGLDFIEIDDQGAVFNSSTLTWSSFTLENETSRTIVMQAQVRNSGTYTLSADITRLSDDYDPLNNTASIALQVDDSEQSCQSDPAQPTELLPLQINPVTNCYNFDNLSSSPLSETFPFDPNCGYVYEGAYRSGFAARSENSTLAHIAVSSKFDQQILEPERGLHFWVRGLFDVTEPPYSVHDAQVCFVNAADPTDKTCVDIQLQPISVFYPAEPNFTIPAGSLPAGKTFSSVEFKGISPRIFGFYIWRISYVSGAARTENSVITDATDEDITRPLHLYPNPFTGRFTVEYEHSGTASMVQAQVFDLYGRVVLTQAFSIDNSQAQQQLEIDGSALRNGSYIIQVNDGQGNIQRTTLIKK